MDGDLAKQLSSSLKLNSPNEQDVNLDINDAEKLILKNGDLKEFLNGKSEEKIHEIVNGKTEHGDTLLHAAVCAENINAIKELLLRGADINARGYHKRTPLFQVKSAQVGQILLDNGADINAEDDSHHQVLFEAFILRERGLLQFFLRKKADCTCIKRWCGLPDNCNDEELMKRINSRLKRNYLE